MARTKKKRDPKNEKKKKKRKLRGVQERPISLFEGFSITLGRIPNITEEHLPGQNEVGMLKVRPALVWVL